MPSIQLSGVAPADAVDENGNPLNPQDAYGFPLYPAPTSQQLRSPNPINWPTRAPGQAPLFDNPVARAIAAGAATGPLRTAPILPSAVRNFTLPQGIDTSESANVGQQPDQNLPSYTPSEMAAPITKLAGQTPPWMGGPAASAAPVTPGTTLTSTPAGIQGPPIQPHWTNTTNVGPQTYGGATAPANVPLPPPRPSDLGGGANVPLPPRRPKNLGGGGGGSGGSASGNRIPPPSVNLGYGAPGVGHYVPTTGIGRGPGTYVPDMGLASQIHNLGVRIGQTLDNTFGVNQGGAQRAPITYGQTPGAAQPSRAAYGGPLMPVDITHYPVAGVNTPLPGALAAANATPDLYARKPVVT